MIVILILGILFFISKEWLLYYIFINYSDVLLSLFKIEKIEEYLN